MFIYFARETVRTAFENKLRFAFLETYSLAV